MAVRLIGFDRGTERSAAEVAVPSHVMAEARRIASVPTTDPDLMGSYPLDDGQVQQMAALTGARLDRRLDWFLEAISPATPP